MIDIIISIGKESVYEEVKKTTEYTASKMGEDQDAYNRIAAIDSDKTLLDRFFNEAKADVTDIIKPFITSIPSTGKTTYGKNIKDVFEFSADLNLPNLFESNLLESIESTITSYFTNYIVSQWYKFTNKKESEGFKVLAESCIIDLRRKIYYRKSPTRQKPTF